MLSQRHRLTIDKEIKKAFFAKARSRAEFFHILLSFLDNEQKFLVVVSKKIYKAAHTRNRIRRRVKAILQKQIKLDNLPKNISCIIQVTSKDILFVKPEALEKEIVSHILTTYQNLQTKDKPK